MNRIIYLHGFASGPTSKKAQIFRERLEREGVAVSVPDLTEGDFGRLTISGQLRVLEREARGEAVTLIGSSMGGYLAALYAARHPEVERVVLLAPAFSFARRLPGWLTQEQYEAWRDTGWHPFFNHREQREIPLHFGLIEDAGQYEEYPDFRQPGLILHGSRDTVVPLPFSEEFAASHPNARLVVVDDTHELMDQIERVWSEVRAFLLG